ncbi:AAA family ATPase [Kroppenstedtia pulmonis]|uniref:AAA family ATPase n=2 Tax=Kroppenstedtia pulmonis TaxID=1380685 RepID=A0A7D3XKX3_9BACL|nr:AAA family ATPase [Kroppenstedtia pulmonis]
MSMVEQEWKEEQKRVDQVNQEIEKRIITLQKQTGSIQKDMVSIRKNFWEDVTVNLDDPDDAGETATSIRQQAEVLQERERSHRHMDRQLKTLQRLRESPYFGRIDFMEDGERRVEKIYLGIASFFDENKEEFLVYDWRAPISSLYYDYSPGPAQYQTPGGLINGTMELKRQYVIRSGQISSMFDTGVTIGDELLQEVLGTQASTKMKNIVSTIQKEQNQIIRDVKSSLLIVQGAAGSGKTSAALQRVAYLLYRYRETLKAEHIVLFSPNPLFNSYVSRVLPELGEENMQQTTFQEHLERQIGKEYLLEDPFTQMEYVLTEQEEPDFQNRIEGIRYKASVAYMKVIDQYIESLRKKNMVFKDVKFRGRVLISADEMKKRFYAMDSSLSNPHRIQVLTGELMQQLNILERRERFQPWVEEEIQILEQEDYQRAYQQLRQEKQFTDDTFDDLEREQALLSSMVVKRHFKPLRKFVKRLAYIDMVAVYQQLFSDTCEVVTEGDLPPNWAEIARQTLERLKRRELAYEDAAPYLYLAERIKGEQRDTSIRHVFIDEAQDYSPFQFAFIKRLFPRCKMTVLGDPNQGIFVQGLAEKDDILLSDQLAERIVLTKSYRSTRQIVEFTKGMLREGKNIIPFNREGRKPTVTRGAEETELATGILRRIRLLQEAGHQTIAIICKTARESKEAHGMLQKEIPLRLISKEAAAFEEGVMVIPSYLAKGVEFDAVIIYNASKELYGRERERNLFYTACTRGMHELHIFFTGEMSPFISETPSDTYKWYSRVAD